MLIGIVGGAWALVCGLGIVLDGRIQNLGLLAYGEGAVGLVALELWSRQRLQRRQQGRQGPEKNLLWRLLLVACLVSVWLSAGDRLWFVIDRYHGTGYADYGLKVGFALWRGMFLSVLIYGGIGLVRNVIGLIRHRQLRIRDRDKAAC